MTTVDGYILCNHEQDVHISNFFAVKKLLAVGALVTTVAASIMIIDYDQDVYDVLLCSLGPWSWELL